MATKKKSVPQKPKTPKTNKAMTARGSALPPPDNPLLRSDESYAGRGLDSREMALKRLEAIRRTQEMPTEDEEPPAAAQEQDDPPEPSGPDAGGQG